MTLLGFILNHKKVNEINKLQNTSTCPLTTGEDRLTGTTGADTFTGDFSITGQVSGGDVINGGNGSDKLVLAGFTGSSALVPGTAAVRDIKCCTDVR